MTVIRYLEWFENIFNGFCITNSNVVALLLAEAFTGTDLITQRVVLGEYAETFS